MLRRYDTSLSWVLRHPRGILALTLLTIALNVYLFIIIPKGFFPQQDTGRLNRMRSRRHRTSRSRRCRRS